MTDAAVAAVSPLRRWQFWVFLGFMLALLVLFLGLAKWQLDRLQWKQGLIAVAQTNMRLPPRPLAPLSDWSTLDPDAYEYRPVTVTGHFIDSQVVRVFVGLSDSAKGRYHGPGYWIMTPFAIDGGGTVFVNRGFVPQELAAQYADGHTAPAGTVSLSGVAVASDPVDLFTPATDRGHRIDWVQNVARLTDLLDPSLKPVAPVYIDLPAGPPGSLPQGGETTVDFPNNHLGYVYTWLGFALTTLIMLAEWVRRQWQRGERTA